MNYFEPWFECIVPGNNMYVVIPSDNGNVLVKYPFAYGNVIYVQLGVCRKLRRRNFQR